jgi:hypothetical protein
LFLKEIEYGFGGLLNFQTYGSYCKENSPFLLMQAKEIRIRLENLKNLDR